MITNFKRARQCARVTQEFEHTVFYLKPNIKWAFPILNPLDFQSNVLWPPWNVPSFCIAPPPLEIHVFSSTFVVPPWNSNENTICHFFFLTEVNYNRQQRFITMGYKCTGFLDTQQRDMIAWLNIIVGVPGSILNGISLFCLWKGRKLQEKSNSIRLLWCLNLIDFVNCSVFLPYGAAFHWYNLRANCTALSFYTSFNMTNLLYSSTIIVLITINRWDYLTWRVHTISYHNLTDNDCRSAVETSQKFHNKIVDQQQNIHIPLSLYMGRFER